MNSVYKKYIASTLFLVAGIFMIIYVGIRPDSTPAQLPPLSSEEDIISADLSFLFDDDSALNQDNDNAILPVMFLTTNSCSFCVNNIVDFADLIRKNDHFQNLLFLFDNENESTINRFMTTSAIEFPYKVIDSSNEPYFNQFTEKQHLIFVDKSSMKGFHYIYVSNRIMPMDAKEQMIEQVASIWSNLNYQQGNQ